MRRTRFMTWVFFLLSLAFFAVRDFRWALEAPLVASLPEFWTGEYGAAALSASEAARADLRLPLSERMILLLGAGRALDHLYTLERYATSERLREMAGEAERRGDASFLAFAALHLPVRTMRDDIFRFAESAAGRDPSLTWLFYDVAYRVSEEWESPPVKAKLESWISKLKSWDPDNALPYLLEAGIIWGRQEGLRKVGSSDPSRIRELLEGELAWQRTMEAAFTRPQYSSYRLRRFQLERKVMTERGWSQPVVLVSVISQYPVPNVLISLRYANLLVNSQGRDAEAAGQLNKALRFYEEAVRFGGRLRAQGHGLLENLVGGACQRAAYARLVPALKKAGRVEQAEVFEYADQVDLNFIRSLRGDPFLQTAYYNWLSFLVNLFATATWTFLLLSLSTVGYVNAKRWVRKEKKGRIYRVLTIAENYLPVLLFLSCLGLYLAFAPFTRNYRFYLATSGPTTRLDLFATNSYPLPHWRSWNELPLENPFSPYAGYALVALGGLTVASLAGEWYTRRRAKPQKPRPA